MYEIRVYESKEDYENHVLNVYDRDYTRKRDALRVAKRALKEYPIVVVTNSVTGFDEVLTRPGIELP